MTCPKLLQVDRDGTIMFGEDMSSSSDENSDGDESMEPSSAEEPAVDAAEQAQQPAGHPQQPKQAPAIDADGFQTVQHNPRRRAAR